MKEKTQLNVLRQDKLFRLNFLYISLVLIILLKQKDKPL